MSAADAVGVAVPVRRHLAHCAVADEAEQAMTPHAHGVTALLEALAHDMSGSAAAVPRDGDLVAPRAR